MFEGNQGFGEFQELTNHLSLEKILSGDFSGIIALFYLSILIAIYSIIIYHFYRYIARRDCFKPSEKKHSTAICCLKYFFLFPVIAVIFFLGFSMMLLFLAKDIPIGVVLSTSFAIVLAIRITSYYTEDLSRDVAKMLPFALLGVFLVSPSFFEWDTIMDKIHQLPELGNLAVQFIIFIIIIEWILRILLNVRYKIFPQKVKK